MSKILKHARVSKKKRQIENDPIEITEERGDEGSIGQEEEFEEEQDQEQGFSPEEEAFFILEKARGKASQIVDAAKKESIQIEQESKEAGLREGYERGYKEGLEAGKKELDLVIQSFSASTLDVADLKKKLHDEVEAELVDIIVDIAKKVVSTEIATNEEIVVNTVREALRKAREKDRIIVRVNPSDLQTLKNHRQELLEQIEGIKQLELIEDNKIGCGGCVVESDSGRIDARIENKIARAEKAIKVLGQ